MGGTPSATPIRAVEMVRRIRDAFYERTKDMSPAQLIAFIAREAGAEPTHQEQPQEHSEVGRPAPPQR